MHFDLPFHIHQILIQTFGPFRTGTPNNIEEIKTRGQTLWNTIYEPHAKKLADKLGSYHPDFIGTRPSPHESL